MKKSTRVVLAVSAYLVVAGVCGYVWNWAVAGIVVGSILAIDVALCVKSGVWKYYISK